MIVAPEQNQDLLFRVAAVEASSLLERGGRRTLCVCFSSETPVLRRESGGQKYYEVLDHSPENADLKLLQGGAFLDEHDWKCQVGSVKRAWLDSDRKGRAELDFASTALGKERWQLMSGGHRKDVSFGYAHTRMLGEMVGPDGIPVRRFAWAAYEISSTAVGADHAETGVGRNLFPSTTNRRPAITMTPQAPTTDNPQNSQLAAIAAGYAADFKHLDHEIRALRVRADAEGISIRDFSREVLKLVQSKPKPNDYIRTVDHEIGMSENEIQKWSLHRGLKSCLDNNGKCSGYEADVSQQVAKQCGQDPEGFYIPGDVVLGGRRAEFHHRDMQATIFSAGGAAVQTTVLPPVIDLLRNRTVCVRLGATSLAGLQGNVALPRLESPSTPYSVSEIGLLTDSQASLGQIVLTPKRVGVTVPYSKQLVIQSSPDIEAVIRNDIFSVVAIKHDSLLINGLGSNSEPLGILNTPGVGSVTFGGAASWSKIVDLATSIELANADGGRMAYVTTPGVKGAWKKTAVALSGATTVSATRLWEKGNFSDAPQDGLVNDMRASSTNQVPNNLVIFGDWTALIFAGWGGMDVVVDQYTKAKNAEIVITVNSWIDGALRHPQSFTASADAGNQ